MDTRAIGSLGILGGTGPLGRGLAARLASAGLSVRLGSRDPWRAEEAAARIRDGLGQAAGTVEGTSNHEAAGFGELTLLTVPHQATEALLGELGQLLSGRVLVSTAAPMEFPAGRPEPILLAAGSASEQVSRLCPDALVVGAFHTVSAPLLARLESSLDEDVIVTADDPGAKAVVLRLVEFIPGLRGVDGGSLANARFSEGLTPFLIRLNRLHHTQAGIRITGLVSR